MHAPQAATPEVNLYRSPEQYWANYRVMDGHGNEVLSSDLSLATEGESPAEDLRNALQILEPVVATMEIAGARKRIVAALEKIEASSLMKELEEHPYRFLLRVYRLEQRLAELERLAARAS